MKKNIIKLSFAALLLVSCTVARPIAVSNAEIGAKKGTSTTTVVFGYETNSKYGVKDAAKNGKITSAIATVDEEVQNFIFFQKRKLTVTAK